MRLIKDISEAFHRLYLDRKFSAAVMLVIAIGFGLCLYMFSFLQTIAFKPLPFKQGEDIVSISAVIYGQPVAAPSLDYADFKVIEKANQSFAQIGAFSEGVVRLTETDYARRINSAFIEPSMTEFTGINPVLGRAINSTDNQPGARPSAVLSYDLWQKQFGGRINVIGEQITLDGKQTQVIGVMPENFAFPRNSELWLPLQQADIVRGQGKRVAAYARLLPGVSSDAANQDVKRIMKQLEETYPQTNAGFSAFADTFQVAAIGHGILQFILVITAVVFLTLILLFVNVGNLLLARTSKYARDTAIRRALGAPSSSITAFIISESAMLCITGGILGLLIAVFALDLTGPITTQFTGGKPYYWWQFELDSQTLVIAAALVTLAIIITGGFPAYRANKVDINHVLREGSRGGLGKRVTRINAVIIVGEVFLSTAILIVSLLLGLSTLQATSVDYGAKTEGFMTARIDLMPGQSAAQQSAFWHALEDKLTSVSGVGDIAIMSSLPGVWSYQNQFEAQGNEYDGKHYPVANTVSSFPGALQALHITPQSGRLFEVQDRMDGRAVAVVTASFANLHWPEESAVGKRFKLRGQDSEWLTVAGVVNNVLHGQSFSTNAKAPTVYLPAGQQRTSSMSIAVQFAGSSAEFKTLVRKVVRQLDGDVVVYDIRSYNELLQQNTAGLAFLSCIFVIFGIVSLFLAATGIFGVLANITMRDTQEIGIRRALGASVANIQRRYLIRGSKWLLLGLILAIGSCFYITQPIISAFEPSTTARIISFTAISLLICVVMAIAILAPLRKILSIQPVVALRNEC